MRGDEDIISRAAVAFRRFRNAQTAKKMMR
jgi:hypothetical protein